MAAVIRAAGGVVWRPGPGGVPEVCLVHRPRYDDWSLPKGKLEPDEPALVAAVREVREETGIRAVPQLRLPQVGYPTRAGPKLVDYWAMRAVEVPPFAPNSEVDELIWVPAPSAAQRVRYRHDARLLRQWAALPPTTGAVLLVRHAEAVARQEWSGPDHARPLTPAGTAAATALCRLLDLYAPVRLVSAAPVRCRQTLVPLAGSRHLPVTVEPVFDDRAGDVAPAVERIGVLGRSGDVTVVCSQGGVVPAVLAAVTGNGPATRWVTAKGDGWLLPYSGSSVLPPAPLS